MKFGIYSRPTNVTPKREMRAQNERAVAAFLKRGGQITRIPSGDPRLST